MKEPTVIINRGNFKLEDFGDSPEETIAWSHRTLKCVIQIDTAIYYGKELQTTMTVTARGTKEQIESIAAAIKAIYEGPQT